MMSVASASPKSSHASSAVWTQAEVTAATGNNNVVNVYNVPKADKGKYRLAFINPNLGYPYFADWAKGYKAAAKLYGVKLYQAGMGNFDFAEAISEYDTLAYLKPQVVGTLDPSAEGLLQAVKAHKSILMPIDIAIPGDKYYWGVPDASAGAIGGVALGKAVAAKWPGQNVLFVGLEQADTSATVQRLAGALAGYKSVVGGTVTSDMVDQGTASTEATGQSTMADVLTAHPGQKIALVTENDESGGGALTAIQAAGDSANVLEVTLGGDPYGQSLFKTSGGVVVAEVDFNPYAEAFTWVQAALAILNHKPYKQYTVTHLFTPQNP